MLGKKLAQLRKELGLTQSQLAEKFNVSDGAIAMYETDKRKPDLEKLVIYCKFFSVSSDYLLGLSDTKQLPSKVTLDISPTALTLTSTQQNLLDIYNKLDLFYQGALFERAKTVLEDQQRGAQDKCPAPIEGAS